MKQFITAFLFFLQIFTVYNAQSNSGTVEYRHRNTDLEGYISKPAGSGKAPGVVINADIDLQEEMRARTADWQMIYFGDTVHSFTYPAAGNNKSAGVAYNAVSDKRSWKYMQTFLKEILY